MIKLGLFDNAVEVVINNKVVQSIKTPVGGVLYEQGNGTILTIDVPLNIVYSDAFNISGVLKDYNQTGLVGETVKLKVGNTVVASATTTTNGAYSFTQTPVATGNHSFQVIYEGSLTYNASQSSIVNRVISKETTVLTVTSPTNNYMTYDPSVTFIGTLTDDDGTPLTGKTIKIKKGNSTLAFPTTDSNGAFSQGLYSLSAETHNFTVIYEGDSNYSASSVNRTVIVREHDYAISISADKPILSYADEETVTITALLTDNSVAVTGETLTYTVKHESTTIDTGTATTDSNGRISFEYESSGVGDVDIIIDYGILLQERYEIEDCLKTYIGTFLDHSSGTVTKSLEYTLPQTWSIECDILIKQASSNSLIFRIGETNSKALLVSKVGSNDTQYKVYARNGNDLITTGSTIPISNNWQSITMSYDGSSFNFNDDITVTNFNGVSLTKLLNVVSWKSGTNSGQVRNIKVKAL